MIFQQNPLTFQWSISINTFCVWISRFNSLNCFRCHKIDSNTFYQKSEIHNEKKLLKIFLSTLLMLALPQINSKCLPKLMPSRLTIRTRNVIVGLRERGRLLLTFNSIWIYRKMQLQGGLKRKIWQINHETSIKFQHIS